MKTFFKEIQNYILICIIVIIGISILLTRIRNSQSVQKINLIEYIPSSSIAFLKINDPNVMEKDILSNKKLQETFNGQLPTIFLSFIKHFHKRPLLFSFHQQGIILYTYLNSREEEFFKKRIIPVYFSTFAPQIQKMEGVSINFFAGKNNQFLGYYYKNGILIASYSLKLLEETLSKDKRIDNQLKISLNETDNKVPFNLYILSDQLKLDINLTDSTQWRIKSRWLGADFFMHNNKLCYMGSLPHFSEIDSLYKQIADTLSLRLNNFLPNYTISTNTSSTANKIFYFGQFE